MLSIEEMESHEENASISMSEDGFQDQDQLVVARRIQRLCFHLQPTSESASSGDLEVLKCAGRAKIVVNRDRLSEYMRGKHRDIQQRVYDYFNSRPELQTPLEISKEDHRELCMRQLMGLVREAGIRPFGYVLEDPGKYFAILEAVGGVDMSLGIKMGVQYRLYCC